MKLKKSLAAALLAVVMVFSLVSAGALAEGGEDTPGSPLLIATSADLIAFGARVTNGETDLCAELTADITVEEWTVTASYGVKYSSIGKWGVNATTGNPSGTVDSPQPYVGVFDGKGFSLKLTKAGANATTTERGRIALFNTIGTGGVVKNLNLHVNFSGSFYIAGVAGSNYGTIENVAVSGTIVATASSSCAGGVAGRSGCKFVGNELVPGHILNCLNKADVTGLQYVGGIAGDFLGEMRYCGNTGTITGTQYFGGLLTMGQYVNTSDNLPDEERFIVSDCYNAGNVVSTNSVATNNFAALFGGNANSHYMADWRDINSGAYEDFQVSNVFNYGSITSAGLAAKYLPIIAVLVTSTSSQNYTPTDIINIFSNTYYLRPEEDDDDDDNNDGQLFVPSILNGSGLGTELVKTVIKSKTAAEFASAAMADLLNNDDRTGASAPWEYVEGAEYPTIKAGDKDALEAAIAGAEEAIDGLNEEDYTPASWAALTDALAAAKKLAEGEFIGRDEIDEALAALEGALAGLAEPADKTALNEAIAEAKALTETNYTADSWAALKTALAMAESVAADANATWDEIDGALSDLNTASENLVPRPSGGDNKSEIVTPDSVPDTIRNSLTDTDTVLPSSVSGITSDAESLQGGAEKLNPNAAGNKNDNGTPLTKTEGGTVYANPAAIIEAAEESVKIDPDKAVALPIFRAEVSESTEGALATAAIPLSPSLDDLEGVRVGDMVLLKLKNDGEAEALKRVSSVSDISDGRYVITDGEDGRIIGENEKIEAGMTYLFMIGIQDNGPLDWDNNVGVIVDPLTLGARQYESDSSGGGCDTGLGVLGLLGLFCAAIPAARRKSV